MKTPTAGNGSRPGSPRGGRGHFYVAVGVLAVAAVGFHVSKRALGVVLVKSPVPPPARVERQDQRLTSFPETFGHYRLVADGELDRDKDGKPVKDGVPDGIQEYRHEQLGELDITNHPMNWYYSARFVDTQAGPPRLFHINVTYYTGTLDAVPHVAEICIAAGGGKVLDADSGEMPVDVPGAAAPWDRFEVRRIAYGLHGKDGRPILDRRGEPIKSAEYYVFSMNGRPTCSRAEVRRKLAWPLNKYCYYAKVQIAPLQPEPTLAEQDAVCREFLRHAVPVVLGFLPSAQDVEALTRADGS
ncbi:MAG TPA: hypothetical protein VFJ30_03935 [Phycisphaerae bacterium]|nr:hypothetical protein [Phycisphaerae bacterium]